MDIGRFENISFEDYRSTSIHFRSTDHKNGIIYVASQDTPKSCTAPIFINVNNETNKVVEVNRGKLDTSCINTELHLINLVLKFGSLKVQGMRVDSALNVWINLEDAERPSIAKFPNNNPSIDPYYKWELIRGDWYQRVK